MKKILISLLLLCTVFLTSFSNEEKQDKNNKDKQEYYQITVFHFTTAEQEKVLDNYLEKALLPSLHKNKFEHIGVFKPVANDTAVDKIIYVYIPSKTIEGLLEIDHLLSTDNDYKSAAKEYAGATYTTPPYNRYEIILLKAFRLAQTMNLPNLQSPKSEHVYELRSYESATDDLYKSKVKMFNEGDEIGLFKKLGFNAVFYADVLSGSRMPNLMYMTSFENMAARDAHWKAFVDSPEWKQLVALPEYQHNISKLNIILTHAAPYSDF
jgi:NIPSNAP